MERLRTLPHSNESFVPSANVAMSLRHNRLARCSVRGTVRRCAVVGQIVPKPNGGPARLWPWTRATDDGDAASR